jgi:hypothetical protein
MQAFRITALLILALNSLPSLGQDRLKAEMIERCDPQCPRFHRNVAETALTLRLLDPPTEIAVLRVCSKQSMAFALATAEMSPREYADWIITRLGYTPERVLFLRSEDCHASDPEVTAAELWSVPKGADLPPHLETVKSCQFRIKFLGTRRHGANEYEGAVNYRAALRQLITELREKPNAAGVVRGYYLERPTSMMRQTIREAQRLLGQSNLTKNRYLVRFEGWSEYVSVYPRPDPEPTYPSVYFAEVLEGCNQEGTPEAKE